MLGRHNFNDTPEQRSQTLQIIDAHLRQRPDLALVIPASPGRSGIAVKPACRVGTTNCTFPNLRPECAECRRQLNEWRGDEIQPVSGGQFRKFLTLGMTHCQWLFYNDMLPIL